MYCIRSVMVCSTVRIVTPILLLFWSVYSLTWTSFLYACLEVAFGSFTLFAFLTETLTPNLLHQLNERTLKGGLDETIVMPSYTRVAVCLMSVLEWTMGFRCVMQPSFIEWFASSTSVSSSMTMQASDRESERLSFHAAAICFGSLSVVTSTVLLVVVMVFKVAAIKWWIAAYHMSISMSMVPLRLLGIPFSFSFLICAFHLIAGFTITILPSALEAGEIEGKRVVERIDSKISHTVKSIEKRVDKVTGRNRGKKNLASAQKTATKGKEKERGKFQKNK